MKKTENSNFKKNNNKTKSDKSTLSWFITISIVTFILSIAFSFLSSTAISDLSILPAILVLLLVIIFGVIFDIIGVAVTVANEDDFNAKASKKIAGAKTSIKLIRNSAKVANICADVVGDICGVLSGAISALIAIKITTFYNMSFNLQFIISALVASVTVGGKALGKIIAQKESTKIVHGFAKILNIFGY